MSTQLCFFCRGQIEIDPYGYLKKHQDQGTPCKGSGVSSTTMARDLEFLDAWKRLDASVAKRKGGRLQSD